MKVFVTGATGFQGSPIAQELISAGHKVVTLKRDANQGMPPANGIEVVKGGLENSESLVTALEGVQTAVFALPLIFDIEAAKAYTSNFIAAAKKQGVSLVIYNVTFHLAPEETGYLALDMKVAMKELFDASGLNVITLVPDIYIDNLAAPWSLPVIVNNNILPYPIAPGQKVPWISHSDLGKYVAKAVTRPELAGQTFPIGGNLVSGEVLAETISAKINAPVNFISVPTDEYEKQLAPGFGDLAAKEISNLYRFVEQNHETLNTKDFAKTNEVFGVTPQTITEWVDTVNWTV